MKRLRKPHRFSARRGGYLYVAVMSVASIVSIIGFAAMTVAHSRLRAVQEERDRCEARILALSAVENGLATINANALWRTTYTIGVEIPSTAHSLGRGTIVRKLIDPDGNLLDDLSDPADLYGIGRVGKAVHVHKVQIEPDGASMVITGGSWQSTALP